MKPEIVTLTASVPAELSEALREVAERNDRSVSAEVRIAVRAHVESHQDRVA